MKILRFLVLLVGLLVAQPAHATLILYYAFDENTGTTTDPTTGSGQCTFGGAPTWVAGKFNFGIHFDDAQYLTCGTAHVNASSDWTVAAWIRPTTEGAGLARRVFTNGDNVVTALSGYRMSISSADKLQCTAWVGTNSNEAANSTASLTMDDTTWTHVACVKNGTSLKGYINGVEDGSIVLSTATMDYTGDTVVFNISEGAAPVSNTSLLGTIDELRFYDSVETPSVIMAIDPTAVSKRRSAIVLQ